MISNSCLVHCDRVFIMALHGGYLYHGGLRSLGCVMWFTLRCCGCVRTRRWKERADAIFSLACKGSRQALLYFLDLHLLQGRYLFRHLDA